jgi:hypothetical protein
VNRSSHNNIAELPCGCRPEGHRFISSQQHDFNVKLPFQFSTAVGTGRVSQVHSVSFLAFHTQNMESQDKKLLTESRGLVKASLTRMQTHLKKHEPGSDTIEIWLRLDRMPTYYMITMKFKSNLSYVMKWEPTMRIEKHLRLRIMKY